MGEEGARPPEGGGKVRGYALAEETTIERARRLRRDKTKAEAVLWRAVRGRKLGGFKFRRQVPIDRYFADFACLEARLVVELDGGRHGDAVAYDAARTEVLEQAGFTVLRFWNWQVLEELDSVIQSVCATLEMARP